MKILVTGVNGQLGYDVVKQLKKRGHFCIGVDIAEMDITDGQSVSAVLGEVKPDAVIHCAAWTAVDAAEESENHSKVEAVNVRGTENIARECAKIGAKMIYISTDYVFDGCGVRPWQPDDTPAPLSTYGRSKYEGELAVRKYLERYFIVRIAWAFGVNGHNFVKTMLGVGRTHDEVKVVNDQIGTPTYTFDLARLLVDMAESEKYGIYHATNEGGYISWYDFTCEIFRQAGITAKVTPVSTAGYGLTVAPRPFNSRMDKSKLKANGFEPLPDWRDALKRFLKEIADGSN